MTIDTGEVQNSLRSADVGVVVDALHDVADLKLKGLREEVVDLLPHQDPRVRAAAIRTLARVWKQPENCELARAMAHQDLDSDVKAEAISAWAALMARSRCTTDLKQLYQILVDQESDFDVRSSAYDAIVLIADIPQDQLPQILGAGPIAEEVDWDLMREIYGSDFIGATRVTSTVVRSGITKFEYTLRNYYNGSTRIGEIRLVCFGESLLAELRERLDDRTRRWQAGLPPATWAHLVNALEAGFSRWSPSQPQPQSNGTSPDPVVVSYVRRGDRLELALTPALVSQDFRGIHESVLKIVKQFDSALLGDQTTGDFDECQIRLPRQVERPSDD